MKFKYLISITLIALLSGSLEAAKAKKSKKAAASAQLQNCSDQLESCSDQWIKNNCDSKPKGSKGHDACYTNWDHCLNCNIGLLDQSHATCTAKMQKLATTLE
ncbi:hypothetical protein A3F66_01585 [candidate division TM6 bacterium RIFCSPHIGHO2_12_FULL_32_22]|nr:MAG: hypothetical protein A3F66_01585 [candidate division TM6 bacterium RIFCSPHIGHO2_12_FULL_32_22]